MNAEPIKVIPMRSGAILKQAVRHMSVFYVIKFCANAARGGAEAGG